MKGCSSAEDTSRCFSNFPKTWQNKTQIELCFCLLILLSAVLYICTFAVTNWWLQLILSINSSICNLIKSRWLWFYRSCMEMCRTYWDLRSFADSIHNEARLEQTGRTSSWKQKWKSEQTKKIYNIKWMELSCWTAVFIRAVKIKPKWHKAVVWGQARLDFVLSNISVTLN